MGEFNPDYRSTLQKTEILIKKEVIGRQSGKPSSVVEEKATAEEREVGQELQVRAQKLLELYQSKYGFKQEKLVSDDTVESLTACLEPHRPEYILAHLKELDSLATRAEYEPRLLLKAEKAIETWENLAGALPDDLVEDGLRVDAYAIMNLKQYINNLKNPVIVTGKNKSEQILEILRRNNPKLVGLVESMKPFEVEEE